MVNFTYEELSKNFDTFREIFNNAKHAPFYGVFITPQAGYIARITLSTPHYIVDHYYSCDKYIWRNAYTFLITPEGGIHFKGDCNIIKQPKMKWAKFITKWLETCPSASQMRHMSRYRIYNEELIATDYSPEWIGNMVSDLEDRSNIEYLRVF